MSTLTCSQSVASRVHSHSISLSSEMEFPELPKEMEAKQVPEGMQAPMCLCGDPCKFSKSLEFSYTYGLRFWSCANSDGNYASHLRERLVPLCEFVQYHDTEQTPEMVVERDAKFGRRREWFERRWRETKQEEKRERFQLKLKAEKEAESKALQQRQAEEAEAERERKRERARRARQAGPEAFHKGKYPRCTQ